MLSRRDVCGAFLVIRKLAGIGGYSLTLCGGFLECCVAWSDVGGPPGGCHVTLCLSCTGGFDPNVEHRVRGAAELVFAWRLKHRAWFVVCVGLCPAFSRRFSGIGLLMLRIRALRWRFCVCQLVDLRRCLLWLVAPSVGVCGLVAASVRQG